MLADNNQVLEFDTGRTNLAVPYGVNSPLPPCPAQQVFMCCNFPTRELDLEFMPLEAGRQGDSSPSCDATVRRQWNVEFLQSFLECSRTEAENDRELRKCPFYRKRLWQLEIAVANRLNNALPVNQRQPPRY